MTRPNIAFNILRSVPVLWAKPSRMKFSLLFSLLFLLPISNDDWQSKLSDELLVDLQRGSTLDVIVRFSDQADLSTAKDIRGKEAKTNFVFNRLLQTAETQQQDVRTWLDQHRIEYQAFVLVNALRIERADMDLVRQLAERREVARIMGNPWGKIEDLAEPLSAATERGDPAEIEWNIEQINAPQVWDMGYRGEGVVIGNQDTGIDWDHEALLDKYRGSYDGTVDHNYNWHDAIHSANPLNGDTVLTDPSVNFCGFDSAEPCDDNGHGTYTVGISVGETPDNQVGVAPGARWIGCRNMDRGWGSPASYIECFEFFLAPTDLNGENPDPSRAPHVINNSWRCPEVEGCNDDNYALMEMAVDNLKAAGVVVVVSAGNSGPNCATIDAPAAIFENSFVVGATNEQDTITNFSSRGPVLVGTDTPLRKPDIVAPGRNIRGPRRNDNYSIGSGTSASGPHVAGLVALLINANPDLAGEVDMIEEIIEQSALPIESAQECSAGFTGMGIPNIVYGYGRIDALAAVNLALGVSSTNDRAELTGISASPNPTNGVLVVRSTELIPNALVELSDVRGRILLREQTDLQQRTLDVSELPAGVYVLSVRAEEGRWTERLVVQ